MSETYTSAVQKLPRYFNGLDGVRAICVALVVAQHARGAAPYFFGMPFFLGVDVFFVLSGLLITSLLLREESETGKIDLKAFYIRRAARIFPVYYLVLAGYFLAAITSKIRLHVMLHYAWALLLFCMDIPASEAVTADRIPFGATWSLGIEEKFYLLFPVICFVLVSRRYRAYVIPALLLALSVLFHWPMRAHWMFRAYFGILVGCSTAFALVLHPRLITKVPLYASVPIVLLLFVLTKQGWAVALPFDVAVALVLGHLVLCPRTALSWLLTRRPLIRAGKLSYSMYLVHAAVLSVVEHVLRIRSLASALTCTLAAVLGSFVLASLLGKYVEEPCRIRAKRYLHNRQRRASGESRVPAESQLELAS